MQLTPNYLPNGICLNVLANSVTNAEACYAAAEGHVVLGVLTKNYLSDESAITDMRRYQAAVNNAVSVGLGAGSPQQSAMVARVAAEIQPQHVNQVFTGVATSRALLGQADTVINGLVAPSGEVGLVNVATGPLSSQSAKANIPVATAITMLKDMDGTSLKYFPMQGTAHLEEFKAVAAACADNEFGLEPTGGLDLTNFQQIVQIAVAAGVRQIIPHVYSSIIDATTGETQPEAVAQLLTIMKQF